MPLQSKCHGIPVEDSASVDQTEPFIKNDDEKLRDDMNNYVEFTLKQTDVSAVVRRSGRLQKPPVRHNYKYMRIECENYDFLDLVVAYEATPYDALLTKVITINSKRIWWKRLKNLGTISH